MATLERTKTPFDPLEKLSYYRGPETEVRKKNTGDPFSISDLNSSLLQYRKEKNPRKVLLTILNFLFSTLETGGKKIKGLFT